MHSKKHLSCSAIRSMLADKFAGIEDRRGVNSGNSMADIMLFGLACMYFQSVSLLEFQRRMERKEQRNNLCSMFVQSLLSNQGMERNKPSR